MARSRVVPTEAGYAERTSTRSSRRRRVGRRCAQVQQGRLKLDEPYDAPEGTEVDVAVVDDGDDLDENERARLHAAIGRGHDEAQRGEAVPADEVLAKLRRG